MQKLLKNLGHWVFYDWQKGAKRDEREKHRSK